MDGYESPSERFRNHNIREGLRYRIFVVKRQYHPFGLCTSPPQEVNLRRKGREEYAQGRLRFKKHNSLLFLMCWLLVLAFYLAV